MKQILFIHTLFPSQFHLYLPKLLDHGYDIRALTFQTDVERSIPSQVKVDLVECEDVWTLAIINQLFPNIHPDYIHHFLTKYQTAVAVYQYLLKLRDTENYVPEIIVSHEFSLFSLFVKAVYPKVKLICRMDVFHHNQIGMCQINPEDLILSNFQPENSTVFSRIWNFMALGAIEQADQVFCATQFDKNSFPVHLHPKIKVIFDGINTTKIHPHLSISMPPEWQPWLNQKYVLFATRSLEPLRGFGEFLQSIPYIVRKYPNCRFVIVGKPDVCCYGNEPASGKTWMNTYLQKYNLPQHLITQIGYLQQDILLGLRLHAAINVYLTYDWVLSWAMLETMSLGCGIVASRTAPVLELIKDGENGRLVDIRDPVSIANGIIEALDNPDKFREFGKKARQTIVEQYDGDLMADQFLTLLRGSDPSP